MNLSFFELNIFLWNHYEQNLKSKTQTDSSQWKGIKRIAKGAHGVKNPAADVWEQNCTEKCGLGLSSSATLPHKYFVVNKETLQWHPSTFIRWTFRQAYLSDLLNRSPDTSGGFNQKNSDEWWHKIILKINEKLRARLRMSKTDPASWSIKCDT